MRETELALGKKIFLPQSRLDPTLMARQIEQATGAKVITQTSVLDPEEFLKRVDMAVGAWSIIGHSAGPAPYTGVTTDTTGADLLIVSLCQYANPVSASDIVDSKGNTYTEAIKQLSTGGPPQGAGLFYCTSPVVGSDHNVHSLNGDFGSIGFVALSGSGGSPLDATAVAVTASGTTLAPGSVTPSKSGEFCLAFYSVDTNNPVTFSSVDSGFTILDSYTQVSPGFGFALAYLKQRTAGAVNPVLTLSPTLPNQALSFIATFK